MKLSVIIPQYKGHALLHQILWDLYKHCRNDIDEVIVVDDYSQDEDVYSYYVNGMMMKMLPITVIKKEQNDGFLKTANRGVQEAYGDVIILLSNDVRIYKNICKTIKEVLLEDEKSIIGGRVLGYDTGWNTFNGVIYPYVEGWMIACTKNAWNEIGGFDERYGSSDFEDVDFSTTARSKGYTLVPFIGAVAHNNPASSYGYNPNREARTKENREKFREKWIK